MEQDKSKPTGRIFSLADARERLGTPTDHVQTERANRIRIARLEKQNAELAEEIRQLAATLNKLLLLLKDRRVP